MQGYETLTVLQEVAADGPVIVVDRRYVCMIAAGTSAKRAGGVAFAVIIAYGRYVKTVGTRRYASILENEPSVRSAAGRKSVSIAK